MSRLVRISCLAACAGIVLLPASVALAGNTSCACFGDITGDGTIDGADLGVLLGAWGTSATGPDLDHNGVVDGADLGMMLGVWGPCPAPANDDCANAAPIGVGVHPFCTVNATTDGPTTPVGAACGVFDGQIYKDVWFRFEPEGDGKLHATTCPDDAFDTKIAVYGSVFAGVCPCPDDPATFPYLATCNDDTAPGMLCSTIDLDVNGGYCYMIRVGGFNGDFGSGTLQVTFTSVGADCAHPIDTANGDLSITVTGTTVDNPSNQLDTACVELDDTAEWIRFDGPCGAFNNTTTISTCHPETDYDTTLRVFEYFGGACPGVEVGCNDDSNGFGCALDGLNRKSKVSFTSIGNATYFIRVGGYHGATGNYKLTIDTSCP